MRLLVYYVQILLIVSCVAQFLTGCSEKRDDPTKLAIYYVKCVAKGDFDKYIYGMQSCDNATDDYKQNIRTLLSQMIADKKSEGFSELKNIVCERIEGNKDVDDEIMVYLKLTYQNDSTENILIPMLWNDGKWRLR